MYREVRINLVKEEINIKKIFQAKSFWNFTLLPD